MTDETTQGEQESPSVTASDVAVAPATLPRQDDDKAAQERPDAVKNAPDPEPQPERVAQPIRVDGTNRRNGDDGLEGGFVRVVSGEHAGRVGVFLRALSHDVSGYPERIIVRTRDEFDELLEVAHKDVTATSYNGGR